MRTKQEKMEDKKSMLEVIVDTPLYLTQDEQDGDKWHIGFDLAVSAKVDVKDESLWPHKTRVRLACMKGIKKLRNIIKQLDEYDE
jgi:hypothetical protein